MSYNVNELDNRVEEYLSSGLQGAEEWRRQKAAFGGREASSTRLLALAVTWAGRIRAAAGLLAGGLQDWIAGFSEPQEECC
jgi:hypothetical protein